MVNAIENIKPICEVKKVRISGTIQLVSSIIATNHQETLAICWMLEAATKRHMSKNNISLNQCLFDEILDASQKMGIMENTFPWKKKGAISLKKKML